MTRDARIFRGDGGILAMLAEPGEADDSVGGPPDTLIISMCHNDSDDDDQLDSTHQSSKVRLFEIDIKNFQNDTEKIDAKALEKERYNSNSKHSKNKNIDVSSLGSSNVNDDESLDESSSSFESYDTNSVSEQNSPIIKKSKSRSNIIPTSQLRDFLSLHESDDGCDDEEIQEFDESDYDPQEDTYSVEDDSDFEADDAEEDEIRPAQRNKQRKLLEGNSKHTAESINDEVEHCVSDIENEKSISNETISVTSEDEEETLHNKNNSKNSRSTRTSESLDVTSVGDEQASWESSSTTMHDETSFVHKVKGIPANNIENEVLAEFVHDSDDDCDDDCDEVYAEIIEDNETELSSSRYITSNDVISSLTIPVIISKTKNRNGEKCIDVKSLQTEKESISGVNIRKRDDNNMDALHGKENEGEHSNFQNISFPSTSTIKLNCSTVKHNNSNNEQVKGTNYVEIKSKNDKLNKNHDVDDPSEGDLEAVARKKSQTLKSVNKIEQKTKHTKSLRHNLMQTNQDASSNVSDIVSKSVIPRFRREGTVKRGKWILGAKIGAGAFGIVHVGMNTATGTLMAVKSVKMDPAVMKDTRREIELLKSLDHINIVRYYGAEIDSKYLHIFQEWVPAGSVTLMLQKFGPFPMTVLRSYLYQTLQGLSYLHCNNIMHRDIKGSNILVNDDGKVKLADFGASKRFASLQNDMMESQTMRGTPYFMAPEVFQEKYSRKADSWSVGCVAYQMATGLPPWKDLGLTNPVSLFHHMQSTSGPPDLNLREEANLMQSPGGKRKVELFKIFVSSCFARDPSDRPGVQEIMGSSFFSEQPLWTDLDQSDCCSLFSPESTSSRKFLASSVKLSPIRAPIRRCNSIGSIRSPFLSPPLPRHTKPSLSPFSPAPDGSSWPTWAREKLGNLNSEIEKIEYAKESNLANMMGSLAFSDDDSDPIICEDNKMHNTKMKDEFTKGFEKQNNGQNSGESLQGLEFVDQI